ncbi:MAG: AAA family ATPase [Lachnospiraceae bacterium]|nr:AAA family ATPase [Lachnospiraceae bacterium]
MYRNVINDMAAWHAGNQQVLLVKGAKGVGKTWSVTDFAEAFFKRVLIVDFEKESDFLRLFQGTVDADRIENKLRSRFRHMADKTENIVFDKDMLLVFDEVQFLKHPLPGIMAYAMQRPDMRICIIASWMGMLEGEDFYDDLTCISMYPMTFEEFLTANKVQHLCGHIEEQKISPIAAEVKDEIKEYLSCFMMTGGMPEVVADIVKCKSLLHTDGIIAKILSEQRAFIRLMVPHALERKVLKIWDSIPVQLSKSNRKFMYNYVDDKARAREYEGAVKWLVNAGLVRCIYRISEGNAPIADYVDKKSFELYHLDHGLLRLMCGCRLESMAEENDIYDVLSGVLPEQYAIAELTMNRNVSDLYFWISGATARVDLVFEDDGEVIPVDVQSKVQNKAQSLKVFRKKYENRMAIRISLEDLSFAKGVLNIPLYGLWNF